MNNRLSFKDSITGRARPLLLTLLLLLTVTGALAERRERVVDTWRPLHYNVALTLDDRLTELTSARAEISVAILRGRLARLELDFGELPVDSVTVAGRPARFEQHAGRLDVQLLRVVTRNERLTGW
jgi:aminopeptidase N